MNSSRPRYESALDRFNQWRIKHKIEKHWNCLLERQPDQNRLDYFAYRDGEHVAVIEVKRRYNSRFTYPTLMIASQKFDAGVEWHQSGVAFLIVIWWNDGVFFYRHRDHAPIGSREEAGRTVQTRDPLDIEPCVFIPVNLFFPMINLR